MPGTTRVERIWVKCMTPVVTSLGHSKGLELSTQTNFTPPLNTKGARL